MKRLDKIGRICNIILSAIYIPLSFLSLMLFMASEIEIGLTNRVSIIMINIFSYITLLIPLLCVGSIFLSIWFRRRGYSIWSFVVQFLPIVVFLINQVFLFIAEVCL